MAEMPKMEVSVKFDDVSIAEIRGIVAEIRELKKQVDASPGLEVMERINKRLDEIERRLDEMGVGDGKQGQPEQPIEPWTFPNPLPQFPHPSITPQDQQPWKRDLSECSKCGLKVGVQFGGVMGFVCPNLDCPVQLKVTC